MAYTPYTNKNFDTRYVIKSAPEARTDGSGGVAHDIWSQYREDGGDTWVNDQHWTIVVPAAELEVVLQAGSNGAIGAAYKQTLKNNVSAIPQPVIGRDSASIALRADANGLAAAAAAGADSFITQDLGWSYADDGVNFTL